MYKNLKQHIVIIYAELCKNLKQHIGYFTHIINMRDISFRGHVSVRVPKVASRPAGGLGGAVSAPAGYGAEPRSKKCVSKMKKKYYLKLKDMFFR